MKNENELLKQLIAFSDSLVWSDQLDDTIVRLLSKTEMITGANRAVVYLLDSQQESFRLLAQGKDRALFKGYEVLPAQAYLRLPWISRTLKPVIIYDMLHPDTEDFLPEQLIIDAVNGAAIPLVASERLLGMLCITYTIKLDWTEKQIDFLTNVGRIFGSAIYHAHIIQRTQELAVLRERTLISRELHDGFSQDISSLGVRTEAAILALQNKDYELLEADLDCILESVHIIQKAVREEMLDLRSCSKEDRSLIVLLNEYLERFMEHWRITVEFVYTGNIDSIILSTYSKMQLLRVTQEALSNVRLHAKAKKVLINLSIEERMLVLKIKDDGVGFDPSKISSSRLGLHIMKERIEQVGGVFDVSSVHREGTNVTVKIPAVVRMEDFYEKK
ncbi:MAG: GAF domain-containing sensor histidine kinase [Peptococcaceae bacterium]|nr:GAF domain-containing sensor histidine kinase [Peptococcaceae bacterium]